MKFGGKPTDSERLIGRTFLFRLPSFQGFYPKGGNIMKHVARHSIILLCATLPLLGWETEPEFSLEGVLKTAERQRMTRYPDGREEKWMERHTILVTDEPIILSRSISIANQQPLVQQETLSFIRVLLSEEFQSLMGKRVEVHGHLTRPFDFFLLSDVEFDVDTALDVKWQQTHQTSTVLYEPSVTELQGTLYQKTYPGPPEYESIEAGDTPEAALILALTEPVDVQRGSEEEDDYNQLERGVREVEVVFSDSEPPKDFWEQGVTVRGTLFSAHTAHHRRRVLMMAKHWSPLEDNRAPLSPTQSPCRLNFSPIGYTSDTRK